MYVLVSKLEFSNEGLVGDRRELKALMDRLRKKFKVQVQALTPRGPCDGLVVSLLGYSDNKLSQTMDDIAAYCEYSGFGRVDCETTFLDHIDNLFS